MDRMCLGFGIFLRVYGQGSHIGIMLEKQGTSHYNVTLLTTPFTFAKDRPSMVMLRWWCRKKAWFFLRFVVFLIWTSGSRIWF